MVLAGYIVVFKKSATSEQINKYADDVNANGKCNHIMIYISSDILMS